MPAKLKLAQEDVTGRLAYLLAARILDPQFAGQTKEKLTTRHAAKLATEQGYRNAFDILEGFEGDPDGDAHRGNVGGWRKRGLPWRQN